MLKSLLNDAHLYPTQGRTHGVGRSPLPDIYESNSIHIYFVQFVKQHIKINSK